VYKNKIDSIINLTDPKARKIAKKYRKKIARHTSKLISLQLKSFLNK